MAKWADGPITPRAHLLIGPVGHRNKFIKHRTTAIGRLTFGGRSQVCPAVRFTDSDSQEAQCFTRRIAWKDLIDS